MKKKPFCPGQWLVILFAVSGLVTGCTKSSIHSSGDTAVAATDSLQADFDPMQATLLINGMATDARLLLDPQPSSVAVTGYDFNGVELGKPADLFCGANIGGGEDADNFLVNVAYNGPDCSGQFFLKGKVVLQVPRWVDWKFAAPGTVTYVFVHLNNIEVTRLTDHKHVSLSGVIGFRYNNDNLYGGHIASVAELKQRKDPSLYVEQLIFADQQDSVTIHYDDGSHVAWVMNWFRRYQYQNGQLSISQQGSDFFLGSWTAMKGNDPVHGQFYWVTPKELMMWENCHYKVATGSMSVHYPDNNPAHDSASVVFGVNRSGQPGSRDVQAGVACLDAFFLHYTSYSQGSKTADVLFPE